MNDLPYDELILSLALRTLTCIFIGLAFTRLIISEIMITFYSIHETIDIQIEKERLSLVRESQEVLGEKFKNKNWFPKAIIIRKADNW